MHAMYFDGIHPSTSPSKASWSSTPQHSPSNSYPFFFFFKYSITHWVLNLHTYAWVWSHPLEYGKSTQNQTSEGNWLSLPWQLPLSLAPQLKLGTCVPTPSVLECGLAWSPADQPQLLQAHKHNCHVQKTLLCPAPPQPLALSILLVLFCEVPGLWMEGCDRDDPWMDDTLQPFSLCALSSYASLD